MSRSMQSIVYMRGVLLWESWIDFIHVWGRGGCSSPNSKDLSSLGVSELGKLISLLVVARGS